MHKVVIIKKKKVTSGNRPQYVQEYIINGARKKIDNKRHDRKKIIIKRRKMTGEGEAIIVARSALRCLPPLHHPQEEGLPPRPGSTHHLLPSHPEPGWMLTQNRS